MIKRTAIGALFFGILMGAPDCFRNGTFQPTGLLKVLGMAVTWGILFYLGMALFVKLGEKKADSMVETASAAAMAEDEAAYEE